MDAVAKANDGSLWLIEVKDYRRQPRSKPSSVFDEVASKASATLAGLAAASVRATDPVEKGRARQALSCSNIRGALQLGQPTRPSRLFPQVLDPADAQLKLRQVVRALDPRALCSAGVMEAPRLPWKTESAAASGLHQGND